MKRTTPVTVTVAALAAFGLLAGAGAIASAPVAIANPGSSGYKSTSCQPPYAGTTTAKAYLSDYNDGAGQTYHYGMTSGWMSVTKYNPVEVYANGVRVYPASGGYRHYLIRSARVTWKFVWGSGPWKTSCTIYNY